MQHSVKSPAVQHSVKSPAVQHSVKSPVLRCATLREESRCATLREESCAVQHSVKSPAVQHSVQSPAVQHSETERTEVSAPADVGLYIQPTRSTKDRIKRSYLFCSVLTYHRTKSGRIRETRRETELINNLTSI